MGRDCHRLVTWLQIVLLAMGFTFIGLVGLALLDWIF